MRRLLVRLALLSSLATTGCTRPRTAPPPDAAAVEDPVVLLDSRTLPVADFMARQRVTARHPRGVHTFDAVLQLADGTLRMIGLTPFGTKGFLLEQRGTEVRFERFVDLDLPFPPERILFDVHRALFYSAKGGKADGPDRRYALGPAFRIDEQLVGDAVVERRFTDARGHLLARIRFSPPFEPGTLPTTVRIEAPPYGYRLEITTLDVRWLAGRKPATSAPSANGEGPRPRGNERGALLSSRPHGVPARSGP
ncbi:MAG: DUF3261 domain-containing protein [Deltaproteobacteria bacterium]|nr:MAG: DUF3261 domain-containing protein [Deltaproteobacteria bacterium]